LANSRKKANQKDVQRKKRLQRKKEKQARKFQKTKDFLSFDFKPYDENGVSEGFVTEVKRILKGFRLSDRTVFSNSQSSFFKSVKKKGIDFAVNNVRPANHKYLSSNLISKSDSEFGNRKKVKNLKNEEFKNLLRSFFRGLLSEILFSELKKQKLLERYVPQNMVYLIPVENSFDVVFKGLSRVRIDIHQIYYSSNRPKIEVNGKKWIVGFTPHAIVRIRGRGVEDWTTFAGAGDAFAYLNNCNYFEVIKGKYKNKEQYYFTFYEGCSPNYFSEQYAINILDDYDHRKQYYYRIGYCPIAFNSDGINDIACGLTMLPPGGKYTPEWDLCENSNLPWREKRKILRRVKNSFLFSDLIKTQDFSGLKWFHDNGISQVITLSESPYREIVLKKDYLAGSKFNGQGVSNYPDGSKYEGQFKDGKTHGHGILTESDSSKYEGEWKNGIYHGQGILEFSDGKKYEGEFKDGVPHGQGKVTHSDGQTYVGEFKNGIFSLTR
jgi:hypothetical protein